MLQTDTDAWMRIFVHQRQDISSTIFSSPFFLSLNFLALSSPQTTAEKIIFYRVMMSILGAWAGAFVIPLDWDRPWQVRAIFFT